MHLLLVRHGESVDNAARVYAGSRDSPLTNHGILQAESLGSHLSTRREAIGPVERVFTSNLRRAVKTAEAVAEGQQAAVPSEEPLQPIVDVLQLPELREKDFGPNEGKKFSARQERRDGRDGKAGEETREAMTARVNKFIDVHLFPAIEALLPDKAAVVIVAHGIILNALLKSLLNHFPAALSTLLAEKGANSEGGFLASWSNTGVLYARVEQLTKSNEQATTANLERFEDPAPPALPARRLFNLGRLEAAGQLAFVIESINNTDHLAGLRKTRGGIKAAWDPRQSKIDSFFAGASRKRKADST